MIDLHERMLPTRRGSNAQPPVRKSDAHSTEPPGRAVPGTCILVLIYLLLGAVVFPPLELAYRISTNRFPDAIDLITTKTAPQNRNSSLLTLVTLNSANK